MISGRVTRRREAVVRLRVRGPGGDVREIPAVVDTGFSAALTLSPDRIADLGLPRVSAGQAHLADGSVRPYRVFAAEIEWDGAFRPILVSELGDEVLLGMRVLDGHELRIRVRPGGEHPATGVVR